jgi:predicted O-methyltransferase YrrM
MTSIRDSMRFRVGTQRQIRRTARELRIRARAAETPEELVAAAFATMGTPSGVGAFQDRDELTRFVQLVSTEQPRRTLEIGTGSGGTLYALAWASPPGAQLLSLDLRIYPSGRRALYRTFAEGRRVDAWEADSHLEETRDLVARYFDHEPLDLLFIDGDHTYESVRTDYKLYAPLVRTGGIIAFHDIVDGPHEAVGDAPRFWREIYPELEAPLELVTSWNQGGFGIGVGRRQAHR